MRRNQYEEALFRCEDDHFEADVILETTRSAIAQLELLQKELEATRLDVSLALNGDNYATSMTNLLNQTTVFDPLQLGDGEEASRLGDANQTLIATDEGEYVTYEDLCKQHMVGVDVGGDE